jgi:N-acyl-D-amino-acid deacylase
MGIDLLIRGGEIVDGSVDATPRAADVAIEGDRISAVEPGLVADAATVIDATGRYVAPGFIDTHVHSEAALLREDQRWASLIQGVTTHLAGPDGFGWAGLPPPAAAELWRSTLALHGADSEDEPPHGADSPAEYLAGFRDRLPVDLVPMIPHLALRFGAMGWRTDAAGPAEIAVMQTHAEAWLAEGAAALSVGLDYAPSIFATTDELVALAGLLVSLGLPYAAHGRHRRLGRAGQARDTVEIGRLAGVPVVLSHDRMDDELDDIIAAGERAGVSVAFDSHMYPAGCTHLLFNVPEDDQAIGVDALLERLEDPRHAARIAASMDEIIRQGWADGAREIIGSTGSGRHVGMTLRELADDAGVSGGEMAVRLLREERADVLLVYQWAPWGGNDAAYHGVEDRTLAHPALLVASDGLYRSGTPHPRGYGTFARALGIVRERAPVSWGEAIHAMTGKPADVYGLRDRGRLTPGLVAHAVIFDPATVAARATWEQPQQGPVGIDTVIVNGVVAVADGQPTGELAGRTARALA